MAAAIVLAAGAAFSPAQTHEGVELVKARLLADSETIVPGRPITLGLHLKMEEGWHTYWEYPGDSGMATRLELDLPDGFRATPLQWPLPTRSLEPGDLEVYSYKKEVLLLMRLFPAAELEAGEITIRGDASWLVCDTFCLPGQADLSLKLEVDDSIRPANEELFERFRAQLPQPLAKEDEEIAASWRREKDALLLTVDGPEGWRYEFFPLPSAEVVIGHPAVVDSPTGEGAVIEVPLQRAPDDLTELGGVVVATDSSGERRGWRLPAKR